VKKLVWIGSSYKDLKGFPPLVRQAIGYALFFAQNGKIHEHAKVLSGMGSAKIHEVRENDKSGTYRVVYTVETTEFVFILHAFQKKSKSGIATPKQEMDLLKSRLKEARDLYKAMIEETK
jgi:phage-related protein